MEKSRLNREIWAVVIGLTALLIALSLLSYDGRDRSLNTPSGTLDTHNWGGFVGAFLSDILLQGLGLPSFLLPIFLCIGAAQLFRANYRGFSLTKTTGYTTLLVSVAVLLSIFIDSENARETGGIVGGFLKESVLVPLFGRISATLIAFVTFLLSLMLVTQNSLLDFLNQAKKNFAELSKSVVPAVKKRVRALKEKREHQERAAGLYSTAHSAKRRGQGGSGQENVEKTVSAPGAIQTAGDW